MPKFCANITLLFTELPFLQRFGAAAAAGFAAVECQFPYDHDASAIAHQLRQHQLKLILFNLPAGNWARGDRGIACHPERIRQFRQGVAVAIDYARTMGCRQCNALAGVVPPGFSPQQAQDTLVANLAWAAPRLADAGISLLVEGINTQDVPGFFLNTTAQAMAILDEVNHPNVFYQYDIYHMQIMEGNLAQTIAANLPRIGHMQLADTPGRHEPGSGSIDFDSLLPYIDQLKYSGWIGAEYLPATTTSQGLTWLRRYL